MQRNLKLLLISLLVGIICIQLGQSKLNHQRPSKDSNGIGKLMISHDDSIEHYNPNRLMIKFNMKCLESSSKPPKMGPSKHILSHLTQQMKINSLINNHIPCLSHHNNKNFQINSQNTAISFLNINHQNCLNDHKDILINYDKLCIDMIIHEPIFHLYAPNSTSFGTHFQKFTSPSQYTCANISTSNVTQWNLDQIDSGATKDSRYYFPKVDHDNGVDLYIVDSGVEASHDEFYDNQVIHEMGNGPINTDDSHGTHVAGTAGGKNYGMSRNLTIYDYKVCTDGMGCPTNELLYAMEQIAFKLSSNDRRGVINLSLGGTRSFVDNIFDHYFNEIIKYGGIVVVAAGNENQDACGKSPAASPFAITVGASDVDRQKAYFSNWGKCVNIWAPGHRIYSSVYNNTYQIYSGTSMATPTISGIIANLLYVDPTLTQYQILNVLLTNTITITGDQCNDAKYKCKQPDYNCGTLPSSYLNTTQIPMPTEFNINNRKFFKMPNRHNDFECNYLATAKIDFEHTDNLEKQHKYFIKDIEYQSVDKCFDSKQGQNKFFSYAFECTSEETVALKVWPNGTKCETSTENTPFIAKTFTSGQIEGNDWYTVNCSSSSNELLTKYDESDCDITYRIWYTDNEDCKINQATTGYIDGSYMAGACYMTRNETVSFSYKISCAAQSGRDTLTYAVYDGMDCDADRKFDIAGGDPEIFGTGWCYSSMGLLIQVLECPANPDDSDSAQLLYMLPHAMIFSVLFNVIVQFMKI